MVERCVRDAEVAGSNPVISTIIASDLALGCGVAFLNECKEKMGWQTEILYYPLTNKLCNINNLLPNSCFSKLQDISNFNLVLSLRPILIP